MFTSIIEYLTFFRKAKSSSISLQKGDLPKVAFKGYWIVYIFIAIFAYFILTGFFGALSIATKSFSFFSIFSILFICILFSPFFLLIIIAFQANFYYLSGKKTSFKNLLLFNLTSLFKFLHIPFYNPWITSSPFTNSFLYTDSSSAFDNINLKDSFALLLGKSTGLMSTLWHSASLAPNQNILLSIDDASKNILCLGGIGSGKTSAVMQPLLLQMLDQKCGGLIFDIKGDVKNIVLAFANKTSRNISIIGPNNLKINLLAGLTPEIASSFLKSSLLLANQGHLDLFWIDTAAELSRNILGLLSFIPDHYHLAALYGYIFDKDAFNFLEQKLTSVQKNLNPKQKRLFTVYHQYKSSIFDSFDDKVKSGVKATLAQAISPFNHPDLTDAFCSSSELKMDEILSGSVFLVDVPISTWGLGAKVAYTFIKLRFFNLMQKHHNAENRTLPVFFMCDEFQEIVSCNKDGLSDLNFWDKSRSSKTIGIISAQSISSFFAATPSRDYAYALLQNFRNKICLSTEDPITIEYISQLTGKAKTMKKTSSYNNETISEVRDSVLEAQIFRSLPAEHAISLLSINNKSRDDAIKLFPIYTDNSSNIANG
ncbi:type IV secretory system conjugative DNA transfer family protein [Candidatus Bandiella euplotis]|uniref:RecA-like DNA-binding protein n=1 Tax=Candidatus Bandiella euplotis TaxID=1664265 RepID=A0ABZ0UPA2_9RICK|nr:type IV secretion system DNA-binding domain-containing protein [Candidatus Bandiella woodruffii]WPX97492.1 Putative RecA-like DNA-binding protein [Candidatus Bandiella woodruffii]